MGKLKRAKKYPVGSLSFEGQKKQPMESNVEYLLKQRAERADKTIKTALRVGRAMATGASLTALYLNPTFRKGVALIAAVGVGSAALSATSRYKSYSRQIKDATHFVGSTIGRVAKENDALRNFLGEWRYVLVDKNGDIKGTNRSRILGIGRLRLETNKILAGKY